MKQCPQCSTQYEDNLSFCPKDGRALIVKTATTSKLCPQCANSVAADAVKCPYCKAELGPAPVPQWPTREDAVAETAPRGAGSKVSTLSGAVFGFGLIFLAAGLFLMFGQKPPAEVPAPSPDNNKELQQRDQRIQSLETELNRVRQELTQRSDETNDLKTKLEETQKDLTTTQQRLATANRETERLASSRAQQPAASTPSRPANTTPPPPPPAPLPPRRAAPPGTYETTRATTVYEQASGSSRVVSPVPKGTRVEVVRSSGDWLEVRSKHGNPPGYIRADDAMFISSSGN